MSLYYQKVLENEYNKCKFYQKRYRFDFNSQNNLL